MDIYSQGGRMKIFILLIVWIKSFAFEIEVYQGEDKFRNDLHDYLQSKDIPQRYLNYENARKYLFGKIHLIYSKQRGYSIEDVYCSHLYTNKDFPNGPAPAPMTIPDYRVLNTEHLWPQSHFTKSEIEYKKTDLHHLFPAAAVMNSSRSNILYGEVETPTHEVPCAGNKVGYPKPIPGQSKSELRFEPNDEHKGDIARAIFYFSVRYSQKVDDLEEYYLRIWNTNDPPDDFEKTRNDLIESIQGNRNPFIDNPKLVQRIKDF